MSAANAQTNWPNIPLRYVCELSPPVSFAGMADDDEITFLPMEKIKKGRFTQNIDKLSKYTPSYNAFEEGDILLAKVTPCFENGNIAIAENLVGGRGFGSSELFVVRPTKVNQKFLFYYFQSSGFKQLGEASMTGAGGLKRVSPDLLRQHHLPLPSAETQYLIADYLDQEIVRIDSLITEKERMFALLEEKRVAFISRIVTHGLDPDTPMKPSDREWFRSIPVHWPVMPIKHLATVGNGSTPQVDNPDYWDTDGFPWLNSSVVNSIHVEQPSRYVTEKALKECHLPLIAPPAVLVGITGQGRTRGMAATLAIEATINQHLAFIKPADDRLAVDYLHHLLGHAYSFLRSNSDGSGSTKGAITCEQLSNMKIPVPPASEQTAICSHIQKSLEATAPLIKELNHSIALLKERRAALITAAVTGQIPLAEMASPAGVSSCASTV